MLIWFFCVQSLEQKKAAQIQSLGEVEQQIRELKETALSVSVT
jgi:hypothetical protein